MFAWRRATGERETGWRKRGVSLVSGMICGIMWHVCLVRGQTVGRRDVRDVAVTCGFARPWWKVRLRGAVPQGSAKHETRRVAGERDDWRYHVIGQLLMCGQTVWRIMSVMSQCHADLCGLGGNCVCAAPCHWGARNRLA